MFQTSTILDLVIFWFGVFIIDITLKNCSKYKDFYTELLDTYGFHVSIGHIRWQTKIFNRTLLKIGRLKPYLIKFWFNCGVVFGVFSMIGSVVILVVIIIKFLIETNPEQLLQPVMPGMNLPWNQLFYYVTTLILAGACHEVGHAIAAIREDVGVNNFGLFLLIIYPGAFVNLHTDQLEVLSPIRKLRIFCAGVWHNVVLALVAFLITFFVPYLLSLFYITKKGAHVLWIHESSSIASKLQAGDTIHMINECPVYSSEDWLDCLRKIHLLSPDGFCNSKTYIRMHNSSTPLLFHQENNALDCCNDASSYRFCFHYNHVDKTIKSLNTVFNRSSNVLTRTSGEYSLSYQEYACLPARLTITQKYICSQSSDCADGASQQNIVCLKPLLGNSTKLVRVKHENGQDILFVGEPFELVSTIILSNYIPKYWFVVRELPERIKIMCYYILSISSSLAILNMVPCYFLDGHQALIAFLEILFPSNIKLRRNITSIVMIIGSTLLLINMCIGFHSLVKT